MKSRGTIPQGADAGAGIPVRGCISEELQGNGAQVQGLCVPGWGPRHFLPDSAQIDGEILERGLLLPEPPGEPVRDQRVGSRRSLLPSHFLPQNERQG